MALTKIPAELSSTPGISDSSTSTAITIDSSGNVTFNGAVTATAVTQSAGDGSTKIATTAYADAAAAAVVDAAPSTLDTLNELAAALGDDPNFATTVTNSIAAKAPIANPTFTGSFTSPGIDDNADAIAITIDSSENVGIGGAPNAGWRNDATDRILTLGTEAAFHSDAGVTTELWNNAYVDNSDTFKNISTRGASRYMQYSGAHKWFTAASASAGSTISTEINSSPKMVLDVSGNVGIGTSSPGRLLTLFNNDQPVFQITNNTSGTASTRGLIQYIASGTTTAVIDNQGSGSGGEIAFMQAGTERMRIASDGSISTPTAGTSNVRFGVNAGNSIASGGNYNVVVGDEAGTAITTGDRNVAIGYSALSTEDTATHNTAVGAFTLATQNAGDVASYNTAVGHSAGYAVTTGINNTLIGALAGDALTSPNNNVAVGSEALTADTLGTASVAIGRSALKAQNFTTSTSTYNTAVGYVAGLSITTGVSNTLIGGLAGDAMTDADYNVAVGVSTLGSNVLGSGNTALGSFALANQTFTTATSSYNTAVGYDAGVTLSTGTNNTIVGSLAGSAVTTGASNIFLGKDAGDTTTSGSKNICIGQNANSDSATTDHTIVIGHDIAVSANHFGFGKASNIVYNVFTTNASWARSSDERLKKNVQNTDLGLNFINDLRTVKYNWKANHELDSSDTQLAHLYKEDPADNDMDTESTMHGFIAQEVKTALDTAGVSDWGGWLEDGHGVQQISREMFVIPLVKAVQELSAQVTALQAEVAALKGE